MEKGNINVIIFDQDEPSVRDHRDSRTVHSSKQMGQAGSHQLEIIEQEIQYLSEKIKGLEAQTGAPVLLKNESTLGCKHCSAGSDASPDHSRELVMVIEKKIQIIVRQTRKLVDKLGESFEKKLDTKLSKKYDEHGITKVKQNYAATIKKIEQAYRKEIDKVNKEHKDAETRMLARVNAAEQKLIGRMNELEVKEKEYVDWIHHLQAQLKQQTQRSKETQHKEPQYAELQRQLPQPQVQNRSKKMIEVTQAQPVADKISKKDLSENSSVLTGDQNYSSVNPQKNSNQQHQTSKVHRRHRIFDPMDKSSSSVSPNSKVVSPLSVQPQPSLLSSKAVNPLTKPRLTENPAPSAAIQQPVAVGRMTEPLKNSYNVQVQSSPWKAIDKSIEKSYGEATRRNQVVKDVNEDEFYKDLPKANQGWEKFQDYQENESSSDSEQDVIFYRSDEKHQQFGELYKQNKWRQQQQSKPIPNVFESKKQAGRPQQTRPQQKVFSPFDL